MHCGPRGQLEPEPAKPATLLRKGELISGGEDDSSPGERGLRVASSGSFAPEALGTCGFAHFQDIQPDLARPPFRGENPAPLGGNARRYRQFSSDDKSRGIPSIYFSQSILCPGTRLPCSYP